MNMSIKINIVKFYIDRENLFLKKFNIIKY